MSEHALEYRHVETPIGPMLLAGSDGVLRHSGFPRAGRPAAPKPGWRRNDGAWHEAGQQLQAWFAGELTAFDLVWQASGDAFNKAVWAELEKIPYGGTLTYGEVATRIGQPLSASRAVGAACGANPLPIFIPCHRVVGANGALVGFGGGLPLKRRLLDLEFRVSPPADALFAFS